MKRIGCGLLIAVAAFIALMVFLILPSVTPAENVPGLVPLLQTLLCEKGETLGVERQIGSDEQGEASYSANFSCVSEANNKRDVTSRVTMIGIAFFVIPLVVGIVLMISGALGGPRRPRTDPLQVEEF